MPTESPPQPTPQPAPRTAFEQWYDQNPLRRWRLQQTPRVTLLDAAGRLGVGMSMMQMYERGVHKPRSSDVVARFNEVLGESWSKEWDDWLTRRP